MELYGFLALAALILLTPPILYGWGLYRAWLNGKLRRFLWGSVVAGMTLAAAYLILDRRSERRYIENLTGVPFDLRRPIIDSRTHFAWNGDGGSIEAYPIPPEFHARFISPPADFFHLPKTRNSEPRWKTRTWHPGPLVADDLWVFVNSLQYDVGSRAERFDIETALARKTSFYAYNCKTGEESPPETLRDRDCYIVDFYILDPVADRLYLIYMKI